MGRKAEAALKLNGKGKVAKETIHIEPHGIQWMSANACSVGRDMKIEMLLISRALQHQMPQYTESGQHELSHRVKVNLTQTLMVLMTESGNLYLIYFGKEKNCPQSLYSSTLVSEAKYRTSWPTKKGLYNWQEKSVEQLMERGCQDAINVTQIPFWLPLLTTSVCLGNSSCAGSVIAYPFEPPWQLGGKSDVSEDCWAQEDSHAVLPL